MSVLKPIFPLLLCLLVACTDSAPDIDLSQNIDADLPPLAEIYTPLNGDTLPANTAFSLDYEVVRGSNGVYVEIHVDKNAPEKVVGTSGRHRVEGLSPGKHRLSVIEFDKRGKPTGAHASVSIMVE